MENIIKKKILELLMESRIYNGSEEEFNDETFVELFKELDSLNLVSFVIQIENEFDIELPDEYLNFEIFTSLNQLVNVIQQLKE